MCNVYSIQYYNKVQIQIGFSINITVDRWSGADVGRKSKGNGPGALHFTNSVICS
jgi:hypothetical protein